MKILIAGDSWGCGEWGRMSRVDAWITYYDKLRGVDWPECPVFGDHTHLPQWVQDELTIAGFDIKTFGDDAGYYTLLHTGLHAYLEDTGHLVDNISVAGASNFEIIEKLQQQPLLNEYDHIIWIQTDPVRNLRPYVKFASQFNTFDSLINYQQEILQQSYSALNLLGIKINCLGGCSKLDVKLMSKFNNLYPIIDSIPEFLLPNYTHPTVWFSDWYKLVGRQFDITSLDKLLHNKKLQDSLIDEKELFWPDGGHPNRHGYKIIFDYLIDRLI